MCIQCFKGSSVGFAIGIYMLCTPYIIRVFHYPCFCLNSECFAYAYGRRSCSWCKLFCLSRLLISSRLC